MSHYDRKDAVYLRAKREGYRSRAAIKLMELDEKFAVLKKGARILDLGCWPGGWLQVAAKAVGPSGSLVGIDLDQTEPLTEEWVEVITGDVRDQEIRDRALSALGGPADVVLSDMSPKLSGIRAADDARHEALVELAVYVAEQAMASDGVLVLKLFSRVESAMTRHLRDKFRTVGKFRPAATRKGSAELYAVARGLR